MSDEVSNVQSASGPLSPLGRGEPDDDQVAPSVQFRTSLADAGGFRLQLLAVRFFKLTALA